MKTKIIIGLLICGGLGALAWAYSPEVGPPVQGIVEALDRIYESLVSGDGEQQEGFCRSLEVAGDSNEIVLVVPEGERFVLRKLYTVGGLDQAAQTTQWFLTVDDNLFIDGKINYFGWEAKGQSHEEICRFVHDFPDRCVVVDAGQTLKAFNDHSWERLQITVIGYSYSVE